MLNHIRNKKTAKEMRNGYVTPKGLATIAAIESGLLPQVDGGWDDTKFKIFWEKFEKLLEEQDYSIFKISKDRND